MKLFRVANKKEMEEKLDRRPARMRDSMPAVKARPRMTVDEMHAKINRQARLNEIRFNVSLTEPVGSEYILLGNIALRGTDGLTVSFTFERCEMHRIDDTTVAIEAYDLQTDSELDYRRLTRGLLREESFQNGDLAFDIELFDERTEDVPYYYISDISLKFVGGFDATPVDLNGVLVEGAPFCGKVAAV